MELLGPEGSQQPRRSWASTSIVATWDQLSSIPGLLPHRHQGWKCVYVLAAKLLVLCFAALRVCVFLYVSYMSQFLKVGEEM